jgi:hypothetical protein
MRTDADEEKLIMKTRILTGLCVALVANCASVRADDTPAQAAARAALEQEFYHLDHSNAVPSNVNSATLPAQSAESTTNTATAPNTLKGPAVQTAPSAASVNNTSVSASEAAPASRVPVENASAQAVALAALKQKMKELNRAATVQPAETNFAATIPTTPTAAPVREASVAATPVTETPAAEAPVARTPAITSAAVAPASAAPAVAAPAPKVSAVPVVAAPSVAVVPPAISGPVVAPTANQPIVVPAEPILPSSTLGQARPTNELVTITGKIYENVEVERVADDGIVISYTPVPGGWATTKVLFRDLPTEIRQQYEKP